MKKSLIALAVLTASGASFAKSSVTGKEANPLFKQLVAKTGTTPRWNFYKYLIGRDGQVVTSFNSMTDPKSNSFVKEVEKLLAAPKV